MLVKCLPGKGEGQNLGIKAMPGGFFHSSTGKVETRGPLGMAGSQTPESVSSRYQ